MICLFREEYRPSVPSVAVKSPNLDKVKWLYRSDPAFARFQKALNSIVECELVKQNVKRQIFYFDEFYVKKVRYRGLSRLLKTIAGPTACREGQINLRLKNLGVAVPDVIGYGVVRHKGFVRQDVLVTRAIGGSQSLDEFLKGPFRGLSTMQKRQLIGAFATFVRKLHEIGIFHPDLHVGNILVSYSDGDFEFVLLDTDRVLVKGRALTRDEEVHSLALLLNSVRVLCSTFQIFWFLHEYSVRNRDMLRRLVDAVQKKHFALAMKVWAKKAVRCLSSNSRFVAKRYGNWRTYRMREGLTEKDFVTLLDNPDRLLENGTILKAGNTVRAGIISIGGCSYFLKRYNCKGGWYRFRNAFRRSRAVRTWHNMWALHVRNLPIPTPLACFETRDFRLLGSSYILMEYLQDYTMLIDTWGDAGPDQKRSLLTRIALVLGELHRTACFHGDLKWNNILIRQSSQHPVVLTDLDGSKILKHPDESLKSKDIERFLRDFRQFEKDLAIEKFFMSVWSRRK